MKPAQFLELAVLPASRLLPTKMDSAEARAMVIAIALQESMGLKHRRQIKGPARGYVQFERGGLVGVFKHAKTQALATRLCGDLDIPLTRTPEGLFDLSGTVTTVHEAIAWHDVLCAGLARLLLWTLPRSLPGPNEAQAGWECYIDAWRPGKPHEETWNGFYAQAWEVVLGHPIVKGVSV